MHYPSKNEALSTNAIFQRPLQLRLSSQVSVESNHHHRTPFPHPCPSHCQGIMFIRAFFGVESRSVETPSVAWRILSTKPLSTHTNSVHLLLLDQLGCIYKILAVVKDDSKSSKAGTSPEKHIGQCLSPCITWEEEPDKPFSPLSPISRQFTLEQMQIFQALPQRFVVKWNQKSFTDPSVSLPWKICIYHSFWNTLNRDLWTSVKNSTGNNVREFKARTEGKNLHYSQHRFRLKEIPSEPGLCLGLCIWQFWTVCPKLDRYSSGASSSLQ